MTKLPPSQEQRCPACGGGFTVTSPTKRKKIQCPRCRAIVSAASAFPLKQGEECDPPVAPELEWKAECEMLRARIESLETQVEAVLRGAPPNSLQAKQPVPDAAAPTAGDVPAGSNSLAPPIEESSPASGGEEARPGIEAAAATSPRPPFGMVNLEEIALLTTPGDSDTVRLAEVITSILTHAGWKVRRASHVRNGAGAGPGLTLAAGPALCRQRLSRTFTALSAAGYSVALHLDPNLQASETRLIIGRDVSCPSAGSEFARASEAPFIAEVA